MKKVTLTVELKAETEKAILVSYYFKTVGNKTDYADRKIAAWLPKSQVIIEERKRAMYYSGPGNCYRHFQNHITITLDRDLAVKNVQIVDPVNGEVIALCFLPIYQ